MVAICGWLCPHPPTRRLILTGEMNPQSESFFVKMKCEQRNKKSCWGLITEPLPGEQSNPPSSIFSGVIFLFPPFPFSKAPHHHFMFLLLQCVIVLSLSSLLRFRQPLFFPRPLQTQEGLFACTTFLDGELIDHTNCNWTDTKSRLLSWVSLQKATKLNNHTATNGGSGKHRHLNISEKLKQQPLKQWHWTYSPNSTAESWAQMFLPWSFISGVIKNKQLHQSGGGTSEPDRADPRTPGGCQVSADSADAIFNHTILHNAPKIKWFWKQQRSLQILEVREMNLQQQQDN